MSTAFPAALDTFVTPTSADVLSGSTPKHSLQHANLNDAMLAVETLLGTGAGTAVANSVLAGTGTGASAWSTLPTLNISGNATTATTLATTRAINGTNFNGSADITVTAAAGTLTGTVLNSTVVTSSLTSVGTLTSLVLGGDVTTTQTTVNLINATATTVNFAGGATSLVIAANSSNIGIGAAVNTAIGMKIQQTLSGTSAVAVSVTSSLTGSSALTGAQINPALITSGSGTIGLVETLRIAPTVTNASATITNLVGLNLLAIAAAGTVTTASALRVAVPTGGSTNYSLNILSGNSTFANGTNIYFGAGTTARSTTDPTNSVSFFNGTAPAGTLSNGFTLYSASGKPTFMDSAGTIIGLLGTTANGTVATAMSSLGPAGSNTTIQEWLTIKIGANTRYIPCF